MSRDKITISQKHRENIIIECNRNINLKESVEARIPLSKTLIDVTIKLEDYKREFPFIETLSRVTNRDLSESQKKMLGIYHDLKFAIKYLNLLMYGQEGPPPSIPPEPETEILEFVNDLDPPIITYKRNHEDNDSDSYSDSDSDEEPCNYYI